jgi:hypothetical protein
MLGVEATISKFLFNAYFCVPGPLCRAELNYQVKTEAPFIC